MLDGKCDIEVDHVPVDVNLVAAMEVLDFALPERYALYKLDPVSEAHADRWQAVKKNQFVLNNMALETALCKSSTLSKITIWLVALSRMNRLTTFLN